LRTPRIDHGELGRASPFAARPTLIFWYRLKYGLRPADGIWAWHASVVFLGGFSRIARTNQLPISTGAMQITSHGMHACGWQRAEKSVRNGQTRCRNCRTEPALVIRACFSASFPREPPLERLTPCIRQRHTECTHKSRRDEQGTAARSKARRAGGARGRGRGRD